MGEELWNRLFVQLTTDPMIIVIIIITIAITNIANKTSMTTEKDVVFILIHDVIIYNIINTYRFKVYQVT